MPTIRLSAEMAQLHLHDNEMVHKKQTPQKTRYYENCVILEQDFLGFFLENG